MLLFFRRRRPGADPEALTQAAHKASAPETAPVGRATAELRRPVGLITAFVLPSLLLYLVFFVYPMLQSVWLSLFDGSPESDKYVFVGLGNFRRLLFSDSMFWRSLSHSLQFVLVAGTGTLILALALANGLTYCGRGRSFFRVVFLFPNVMAAVAVAILWSFIYNPSFGLLNALLRLLHLEQFAHAWLGEPYTALPALMVAQIWMQAGFYVVLFYAGLLRIPTDFLEAARIDGCGPWQEFIHIRLPLLREILRVGVLYVVIHSLNVFALVFLVNDGQSNKYNNVLLTYLYEHGFQNGNFGYACAIAVMVVVLVLTSAFVLNRLFGNSREELS